MVPPTARLRLLPTDVLPPHSRSRGAIRPQLNPLAALTALLARPGLRPVLAVTFLVATAFAGLQTNLAVFLSDRFGWGPAEVAWVFAVWALASVLMQVCLVGRLSSRLGDIALLVLGFGLTSLSALGIGLAGSPAALWVAVVLQAVGGAIWRPALAGLASKLASAREQGRVSGGSQAVTALGSVAGPIGAGLAFEHLGIAAPYVASAAVTALAVLVVLLASAEPTPDAELVVRGSVPRPSSAAS